MSTAPQVCISASAETLAVAVAAEARQVLDAALQDRGQAHLVVTGGSILEQLLAALAQQPGLDWSLVHVWWGDERYVPSDSRDRNDLAAIHALFDKVSGAVLHRMPASESPYGADVRSAAEAYAAELAVSAGPGLNVPRFDLVLLGVGPDGHCASLFPGQPGVHVRDASVIAVRDSPKPPPIRLSLTVPALSAADELWFVAAGAAKAHAVARALGDAPPTEVPAAAPRGRARTRWMIDRAAASHLRAVSPRDSSV